MPIAVVMENSLEDKRETTGAREKRENQASTAWLCFVTTPTETE